MAKTIIRVPASSANIGPGFDVLGIGLNLFLILELEVDPLMASTDKSNCAISYEGEGSENVPLASDRNLITKTALFVLRCNGINQFPKTTKIHVNNPIPLGRGLGSSGAAVVAGVMLANEVGKLGFSKQRCLDYCLMIERHPDNITAAMIGGFTGSYLRKLTDSEVALVHQPLDEMLAPHAPAIQAPLDIGTHVKYNWNPAIKCIAIIPQFEVPTSESRQVLPTEYSRPDVIFNLQRLAVLTTAVGAEKPDPQVIYNSMQDRLHQPYRKVLIPGLTDILSGFTPQSHAGLLGICLSGAGPTILSLATDNFEQIAKDIIARFEKEGVSCVWKLLEPAVEGATVETL
ncbi:hypothetical protein KL949_004711 [Ogataea haglerorum]|nr:hypothetical protein KL914_004592 [Ogataea haglerorum]KAG7704118.1 hypothetical protein KL950_004445 [Ogataea haglerorum]KAG7713981.1 hypothetical protein KL913_004672 [Ogataea haglerorum]KAG7714475.1 hypothetical protein KL949_004711 [Ogataea haglerorum]KAG7756811.1 hypothetical protein KL947_003531 [Ogataea haglerorum]